MAQAFTLAFDDTPQLCAVGSAQSYKKMDTNIDISKNYGSRAQEVLDLEILPTTSANQIVIQALSNHKLRDPKLKIKVILGQRHSDLNFILDMVRYNLYNATLETYPDNPFYAARKINMAEFQRMAYVLNALLWINSCADYLKMTIYLKYGNNEILDKESYSSVLETHGKKYEADISKFCKDNDIDLSVFMEKHRKVSEYVNTMKHRLPIQTEEAYLTPAQSIGIFTYKRKETHFPNELPIELIKEDFFTSDFFPKRISVQQLITEIIEEYNNVIWFSKIIFKEVLCK